VGTPPPSIGAITLFVEDLPRSTAFYSDVFGLPVVVEDDDSAVFRFGGTLVDLLVVPAARDLVRPGVVAGREAPAGHIWEFAQELPASSG
jgi:catechol 2,3-dioxygenase-like lactoylglutathione lyase family enzyme